MVSARLQEAGKLHGQRSIDGMMPLRILLKDMSQLEPDDIRQLSSWYE